MRYLVLPILLVFFFEMLGNTIVAKIGIKGFAFNSIIGFATFMGFYYVLCFPLVLMKASFRLLMLITLIFIILCIILIIINFKKDHHTHDFKALAFVVFVVILQIIFANSNTIGSISLYDTVNYTNLITGNIYSSGLNTIDFMNGFPGENIGYAYQAYYTFASVAYYLTNGIFSRINVQFFYFTQHTWMYSVILYFFIAQLFVNFVEEYKVKNNLIRILLFIFIILFMGNFYWNSEQAYLGNSYRMIITSYIFLYIRYYFSEKNISNLYMIILLSYANVACANSNSTLTIILAFGLWIIGDNERNYLRILIALTVMPMINMFIQLRVNNLIIIIFVFVLLFIGYFESDFNRIVERFKLKYFVTVLVALTLVLLSVKVSGSLFNFDGFLNNLSGWSDMTWDYTDFSSPWRFIANAFYIGITLCALVKCYREKSTKLLILIGVVFFNPFAANIQNEYMPVFYRNYDIVINYSTIFLSLSTFQYNKAKYINEILIILIILASYVAIKQINYHPNESFNKTDDYNEVLKMTNDEADTILFVKDYLNSNNITNIKAISSILQLRTELPNIKTLYSRNKSFNGIDDDYELYKVFYPSDYFGDPYAPEDPDYCNICKLLGDSDYQLIVQDKRIDYYDSVSETYYSLMYLINECGTYPIYENDTYAVYYYEK